MSNRFFRRKSKDFLLLSSFTGWEGVSLNHNKVLMHGGGGGIYVTVMQVCVLLGAEDFWDFTLGWAQFSLLRFESLVVSHIHWERHANVHSRNNHRDHLWLPNNMHQRLSRFKKQKQNNKTKDLIALDFLFIKSLP